MECPTRRGPRLRCKMRPPAVAVDGAAWYIRVRRGACMAALCAGMRCPPRVWAGWRGAIVPPSVDHAVISASEYPAADAFLRRQARPGAAAFIFLCGLLGGRGISSSRRAAGPAAPDTDGGLDGPQKFAISVSSAAGGGAPAG